MTDTDTDRILRADEVEPHAAVYLVEDTPEGPSRTLWCERSERDGSPVFVGGYLAEATSSLRLPDDGRRVETLVAEVVTPAASDWRDAAWLVIDTETTGLHNARIIELGAVVMRGGRELEHRCALYNPGAPIDPGATAVHGITDAHVRSKPAITDRDPRTGRTPVEGLDGLCAQHDVRAIVGYNALTFDLPLLRQELGDRWVELEAAIGCNIDPLVTVRLEDVGRFWKGKGRHKLTAVADKLKLTAPEEGLRVQAHRAAWDCVLAGRILWRLRLHLPATIAELVPWQNEKARSQRAELDAYHSQRGGAR